MSRKSSTRQAEKRATPPRLTVIILTQNEALHIARAIESIKELSISIVVVDSGSTDETVEIAAALGAQILSNPWTNHATQFNWALDQLPDDTDWIMRLDADEIVSEALREEIAETLAAADSALAGLTVPRRICFLGRIMRYGGVSPVHILRLFRYGRGRCEQRWMDEHIAVDGRTTALGNDLIDHNLQSLGWWVQKHNDYASREVIDILNRQYKFLPYQSIARLHGYGQASLKRWIKENIYGNIPIYIRGFLYFIYRYFARFGFLDGKEGVFFHFLQGFWYRVLVDAKLYEVRKSMRDRRQTAPAAILDRLGINVHGPQ